MATPSARPPGRASLLERQGFWRTGWTLGAMVLALDALFVHDFVLERGRPGIIEQSHGLPWPLLLMLAVPVAHAWLVALGGALAVARLRARPRPPVRRLAAAGFVTFAVGAMWLVYVVAP